MESFFGETTTVEIVTLQTSTAGKKLGKPQVVLWKKDDIEILLPPSSSEGLV